MGASGADKIICEKTESYLGKKYQVWGDTVLGVGYLACLCGQTRLDSWHIFPDATPEGIPGQSQG